MAKINVFSYGETFHKDLQDINAVKTENKSITLNEGFLYWDIIESLDVDSIFMSLKSCPNE